MLKIECAFDSSDCTGRTQAGVKWLRRLHESSEKSLQEPSSEECSTASSLQAPSATASTTQKSSLIETRHATGSGYGSWFRYYVSPDTRQLLPIPIPQRKTLHNGNYGYNHVQKGLSNLNGAVDSKESDVRRGYLYLYSSSYDGDEELAGQKKVLTFNLSDSDFCKFYLYN